MSFDLKGIPLVGPSVGGDPTLIKQVWCFLAKLELQHTQQGTPGVTWLELAALFVSRGGSLLLPKADDTSSSSRTTLPQAVDAFRQAVKMIIKQSGNPVLTKYFGPSTSAQRRLGPLCYDNHIPSIASIPVASTDEGKGTAKFLLNLRCSMKRSTVQNLEAGSLWLPKTKLTLKGVPKWSRFLTTAVADQCIMDTDSPHLASPCSPNADTYITISCPTCGHTKKTTPPKLIAAARWKYTWCAGVCRKSTNASLWLCSCNRTWHTCPQHSTCTEPPPTKRRRGQQHGNHTHANIGPLICPTPAINIHIKHKHQQRIHNPSHPNTTTPPQSILIPGDSCGLNPEQSSASVPTPAVAPAKANLDTFPATAKKGFGKLPLQARFERATASTTRSRFAFGRVSKAAARGHTNLSLLDKRRKQEAEPPACTVHLAEQGAPRPSEEVKDTLASSDAVTQSRIVVPGPSSSSSGSSSSAGPWFPSRPNLSSADPASDPPPPPLGDPGTQSYQDSIRGSLSLTRANSSLKGLSTVSLTHRATSLRVQQYLQPNPSTGGAQGTPPAPSQPSSAKRRRKSQGNQGGKRCKTASPQQVFPAIFARSDCLAKRFPRLVPS